jgi:histidinol-phosphate aminotransferase
MRVPDGMDLLLGNGSDELIQTRGFGGESSGRALMSVEPSFAMFKMIATFTGLRYLGVPLASGFKLDAARMLSEIAAHQPALIFHRVSQQSDRQSVRCGRVTRGDRASNGLVVVDEAYHAFAQSSFLPELDRYPNLLVMRTLSKLGLAGIRSAC